MAPRIRHHGLPRLVVGSRLCATTPKSNLPLRVRRRAKPVSVLPLPATAAFSTSFARRQDLIKQQQQEEEQQQQQQQQTPPPPPPPQPQPQPQPKQDPKKKPRFPLSRVLSAGIFLLIGTAAGSGVRLFVAPPEPPTPGSEADRYTIEALHEQAAKLPIVVRLSADPDWDSWDAYDTLTPEHRAQHITAGALGGARGVGGYQRVFYHAESGEFISVVFFGAATAGWPGVVHGGTLATLLDESCGRAAFRQWGGRAGVTANLQLEYLAPTLANGFYVLRVKPRGEEELPESERGKRHYKCFVDATVEDVASGKVTVAAQALFVGGEGKGKKKTPGLALPLAKENLRF